MFDTCLEPTQVRCKIAPYVDAEVKQNTSTTNTESTRYGKLHTLDLIKTNTQNTTNVMKGSRVKFTSAIILSQENCENHSEVQQTIRIVIMNSVKFFS